MIEQWSTLEIVSSYAKGYFLMADDEGVLAWYSSNCHALIPLDDRFHYPKSLRRVLHKGRFSSTINQAFSAVCAGCADRDSTWISPQLQRIYHQLHWDGWAHSFETWEGDRLAGGVLGLAIGGVFIGESMFFQIPDGSKVALVKLVEHLRSRGFQLFDAQLQNPHLARFGAYEIPEGDYVAQLQQAIALQCDFTGDGE